MYKLSMSRNPSAVYYPEFATKDFYVSWSYSKNSVAWLPTPQQLGEFVEYESSFMLKDDEPVFLSSKSAWGRLKDVKHKTVWHAQIKGNGIIPEWSISPSQVTVRVKNKTTGETALARLEAYQNWWRYGHQPMGSDWVVEWLRPVAHRPNYTVVQAAVYERSSSRSYALSRLYVVSPYLTQRQMNESFISLPSTRVKEVYDDNTLWNTYKAGPPSLTRYTGGLPIDWDDYGPALTELESWVRPLLNGKPDYWPYNGAWNLYSIPGTVEPGPTMEQVHQKCDSIITWVYQNGSSIDPNKDELFGQMCTEAISTSYCNDSNALEFWKDIPKFGMEIKDLSKGLLTLLSTAGWRKTTKDLSKAYLATHYGTQLTLNDAQQWANAVTEWMWRDRYDHCRCVRSRKAVDVSSWTPDLSDGTALYNYALYYDPHWDHRTLKELATEMGLRPTAKNVWEVLPFSFVVDWFYNITEQLKAVTSGQRLIELDVLGQEASYHYRFPVKNCTGLELDFYVRLPSRQATIYPIPIPTESRWKSHWLEGLTLILSH